MFDREFQPGVMYDSRQVQPKNVRCFLEAIQSVQDLVHSDLIAAGPAFVVSSRWFQRLSNFLVLPQAYLQLNTRGMYEFWSPSSGGSTSSNIPVNIPSEVERGGREYRSRTTERRLCCCLVEKLVCNLPKLTLYRPGWW